jgi:CRISPR system Cascade subunit CasC
MSRRIVMHRIRAFPHHRLNVGRSGEPKWGMLGGVRRGEVSSQAANAAIDRLIAERGVLNEQHTDLRTEDLVERVTEIVLAAPTLLPLDGERVRGAVIRLLGGLKIKMKAEAEARFETQYILPVPPRVPPLLAKLVLDHLDELIAEEPASAASLAEEHVEPAPPPAKRGRPKTAKKQAKEDGVEAVTGDRRSEAESILRDGSRCAGLAIRGRMIADNADWNLTGAVNAAAWVTVHGQANGYEWWTGKATDQAPGATGAVAMGTRPFAMGSVFYDFSVLDLGQLATNLGGDGELVQLVVAEYLYASTLAIPSGGHHASAASCVPSLVIFDVRGAQPSSLVNAFQEPIQPRNVVHGDMTSAATLRLARYLAAHDRAYPPKDRSDLGFLLIDDSEEGALTAAFRKAAPAAVHRESLDALVEGAVKAAFGSP